MTNQIRIEKKILIINGIIGLVLIIIVSLFSTEKTGISDHEFRKAAKIMEESINLISEHCNKYKINHDNTIDPYNSGLIGPEMSDITTTLGHLEAKRSTINPNFASLITHLLKESGVNRGDTIAIGCSGSFPALMLASISAAIAMNIYPRIIISLGSSSFGANNINFTLLDIYKLLYENNIIKIKPLAVSLGGEKDIGEEFDPLIKKKLLADIKDFNIPLIYEKNLEENLTQREAFYFDNKKKNIKVFINTGGSYSNMGNSPFILKLKPGLITTASLPERNKMGVIFSMLEKKIPIIHLLYIKGIVGEYNMEWDPVSIPQYKDKIFNKQDLPTIVLLISTLYLLYFAYFLYRYKKQTHC